MKDLAKEYELIESIINALQRLMNNLNKEKQENKQIKNEKLFLEQENERIKAEKLNLTLQSMAEIRQLKAKIEKKNKYLRVSTKFLNIKIQDCIYLEERIKGLENQIKILEQSNSRSTAKMRQLKAKIEKKEKHL
ncbi:hypothetical protein C2G38_2218646 [Gigaspora rosea]|uniref:Uncharacterized protein n=1 Tax=Gigaspora rosea TaxID=44941 RepID=A0A397U7W8_9GLOM|nr:hypothetical protein C2G38_2218646 [Gigaspora rosea]